jgi:hypothetical protein
LFGVIVVILDKKRVFIDHSVVHDGDTVAVFHLNRVYGNVRILIESKELRE